MSSNNKKEKTISKKLGIGIIVILSVLIVLLVVLLIKNKNSTDTKGKQDTELVVYQNANEDLGTDIPSPKDINWKKLKKENEDIYAWIYIPGTDVDYPILQHPTENDYYLDHNIDGSSGYPGCIYSQGQYNGTDFTDNNTILYGHNMKDGSMFASLHNYEDIEFFDSHRFAYIYTPDGEIHAYSIYAAYVFTNDLIPMKYDLESDQGFKDYLEMTLNRCALLRKRYRAD